MTVIRPARPRDGVEVGRFLAELSPTSRYQRFFSELPKVTDALIESLVAGNALIAWDGDTVIGHAMAVPVEASVDIGLVVAESYRRQGIGGHLVSELTAGVAEVRCDVLCGNYFVLRWLRRLMPGMRVERTGETITVHGRIPRPLTYNDYVIERSPDPVDRR